MRVLYLIIIISTANLLMACHDKKSGQEENVKVEHVVFTSEEDVPTPPPPGFTSKFKTLQEWLSNICNTEKPRKAGLVYNFGLFEAPNEYILVLTGTNNYEKAQTHSVTLIEFEPKNMYFTLPENEYKGLTQEQIRSRLTKQLEEFTNTEQFKHSFFHEAKSVTTDWKGEIWTK